MRFVHSKLFDKNYNNAIPVIFELNKGLRELKGKRLRRSVHSTQGIADTEGYSPHVDTILDDFILLASNLGYEVTISLKKIK